MVQYKINKKKLVSNMIYLLLIIISLIFFINAMDQGLEKSGYKKYDPNVIDLSQVDNISENEHGFDIILKDGNIYSFNK